jgi:hypothetical protein
MCPTTKKFPEYTRSERGHYSMAKAIMETSPDINLNTSTDEIVQASVDISDVFIVDQYRVNRIHTRTDIDLDSMLNGSRKSHKTIQKGKIIGSQTKHTLVPLLSDVNLEDRNVYTNKLEEDLTEYNIRLIEIKKRVSEVQDNMREEYLSQVENLDNMRNLHAVKYGKIKKSSGDVWDDLKAATEEAWSELEFY